MNPEAQQNIIGVIEGRLETALDAKAERIEEAKTILLAYSGFSVDRARSWVMSGGSQSNLPRWFEDRVVSNFLQPIARTAAAVITSNKPSWNVEPIGSDAHQRQAARGVQKLLDYFYRTNEVGSILDRVALMAALTGEAGIYVDWDSEVGAGEMEDHDIGRNGWFVLDVADVFSWHTEPGASSRDAHWGIRETTMHIEEARLVYNNPDIEPAKIANKHSESGADTVARHLRIVEEFEGTGVDLAAESQRVRIIQYFQKPSYQHPRGLEVTIAGDTVVDVKDRLLLGEFPVYTMEFIQNPHTTAATGIGSGLLQLQRDLNMTFNGYRAQREREVNPPWIVPTGSINRNINTRPGAINEFNHRAGPAPSPIQSPPFSQVTGRMFQDIVQQMEYISGVNEALRGSAPSSNPTGRLVAFMSELGNRVLGPTVRSMSDMLNSSGKRMLRLWQQHGSETITISSVGSHHEAEISEIRQSDILWRDVSINEGSFMPKEANLRQETIIQLMQMGAVPPQKGLEALEFGDVGEAFGYGSIEALNARKENERLKDITVPIDDVLVWDGMDHEAHIREHTLDVILNQHEGWILDRFKKHIDKHKEIIQQAAMAEQEGQAPPPGAGPSGPPQGGGGGSAVEAMIQGAMAESGGLPPEMIQQQEPGVDTAMEEALASQAGIE